MHCMTQVVHNMCENVYLLLCMCGPISGFISLHLRLGGAQRVPRARRCLMCMRRCSVTKKALRCPKLCQFQRGSSVVAKFEMFRCGGEVAWKHFDFVFVSLPMTAGAFSYGLKPVPVAASTFFQGLISFPVAAGRFVLA